jgi:hypothetical protein
MRRITLLLLVLNRLYPSSGVPGRRGHQDRPDRGVSGGSAASGEAIKGLQIAMDEINARAPRWSQAGTGHPRRRGNPAKG